MMKSGINRAILRVNKGFRSRALRSNVRETRSNILLLKRCPTYQFIFSGSYQPFMRHSLASFTTTSSGVAEMDENKFLEIAELALEHILNWIDGIEEMIDESDISLSQGVLKIDLGEAGTWVLNRQIPNRQIWWSSPISGPRRYEYDSSSKTWLNTRDRTEMTERLRSEISEATGIEIYSSE